MPASIEHGSPELMTNPASNPFPGSEIEDGSSHIKPLTRNEAQAIRARFPVVSPWKVLGLQAMVGFALSLLMAWVWGGSKTFWSALYGTLCVVLPGAVMARGMSRISRQPPAAALLGFMVWEAAKVAVAVALLVFAVAIPGLQWPALLLTMIVSMKVNWLALAWRRPQP
ncbi:MAG: ATP synthase subunit I [Burkholderiales bacterium]